MKLKTEYMVLGIIIVLLAGYLMFHKSDRSRFTPPPVPKLEEKDISRIEIKTGAETTILNRKGSDWFIGEKNFPADPGKITPMLTAIADLKLTALVSEAKAYDRYDLSEDKKISVTAFAGEKEIRRFDVGKVAETYQHTFVTLPNDPNVYHALKNFRRTFEEKANALRNMKVMAVTAENIKEIALSKGDKTLTLSRTEIPLPIKEGKKDEAETSGQAPKTVTVWQKPSGEKVDNETVKRLFFNFSSLSCDAYIDDKKKEDLTAPDYTITLTTEKPQTLSVFPKGSSDGAYPAVSSENDYPFYLAPAVFEGIKKETEALLDQ